MLRRILPGLFLIISTVSAYDADAVLSSIVVKAGARGLAVVLETDGPAVESYQSALQGTNTILRIFLKNVVYGLDEFSFSDFPKECPVEDINAQEEPDGSLIVTIMFRKQFYTKTKAKRVGNRNMFLVSSEAFAPYSWHSSKENPEKRPSIVTTKPQEENNKPAVLQSIRLLKRGDIEQLVMATDNPVHIKTERREGTIIIVFENVVNGLAQNTYALPSHSKFKKVAIKESAQQSHRIGILVESKSPQNYTSFVEIKPHECVIYTVPKTAIGSRGLSLWTHDGKNNTSYDFVSASSLQSVSPGLKSGKEEPLKKSKHLVVIRDNVNFRKEPRADSPETVIMTLRMGKEGTVIKKQGAWYYIRLADSTIEGWIHSSMVAEKSAVSQKQRDAIAKTQAATPAIPAPPPGTASAPDDSKRVVPAPAPLAQRTETAQEGKKEKRVTPYREYGRDPFLPLNQADFLKSELLKIESSALVGILYDTRDRVVLLEDNSKGGQPFALRERDAISNGRVLKIRENDVVFLINEAGFVRQFVLKLNPKKNL